jgi:hypothetical protein
MNLSVRSLALGFLAGVIAVPIFHQGMAFILHMMGQTPNMPWNLKAMVGPYPIPVLLNQMFWGGLWGVAFAALGPLIPVAHNILRGAIYGLLGPFLLGNGVLVPFFKSTGPYFWMWPGQRWVVGGLIGAAFGIGLAVVYRFLNKR